MNDQIKNNPSNKSNEIPDELNEKVIQSDLVYKGMFLKITRDKVELPNGKTSYREYILHPGATCVVPVLPDGRFVLVEQYRHALKRVFLEFPAGKIDKGEDPLKCASRELLEETGYTSKKIEFMTEIHPVIGYANEKILLYSAVDLIPGPQNLDEGEHLRVVTLSADQIEEKLRAGEFSDVKSQAAYFWWKMLYVKK